MILNLSEIIEEDKNRDEVGVEGCLLCEETTPGEVTLLVDL